MPLGETFNPILNPRPLARVFLSYLSGEVKAGRVSNETAMGMLSRLREAISPTARIGWDGYIPTTCCMEQDKQANIVLSEKSLAPKPISQEDLRKIDETKSSIEKWTKARGGSQKVLKVIRENKWPDASTWEFDGRKFALADVKFFAEIEENKIKTAVAPLPEAYNRS